MVVLDFVEELNKGVEHSANKLEAQVYYADDDGIHLIAPKLETVVPCKGEEGEVLERHLQIEHVEVVYSIPDFIRVSV